jgi:Fic family protein
VAANLAAVTAAVASAHDTLLSVEVLCDWHRTLMTGSPTPGRYVGVVRDEQGWIGGTSPFDAVLVTPPGEHLPELLADLVAYAGLSMFRFGQLDPWVKWFADAVRGAGREQRDLVRHVGELEERWRAQLKGPRQGRALRSDALAWDVLELLPRHLVLTATLVAEQTSSTTRAARGALRELADAGVLVEHVPGGHRREGRPPRLFVSPEFLALAGSSPLT